MPVEDSLTSWLDFYSTLYPEGSEGEGEMFDLLAGQRLEKVTGLKGRRARVVVFDSGVGGLTVALALRQLAPDLDLHYVADEAFFPYGTKPEAIVRARVVDVLHDAHQRYRPDVMVVACNTASTLALHEARVQLPVPVLGTVPPIKPAALAVGEGIFALLGTPATVARPYTHALLQHYASACETVSVGSSSLAALAETYVQDGHVDEEAVWAEIAPCFVEWAGKRTGAIALSCTHYPWLLPVYRKLQPWPVHYFDPAPSVARHALSLLQERELFSTEGDRTWFSTRAGFSTPSPVTAAGQGMFSSLLR